MRDLTPILWMGASFVLVMPLAIWLSVPFAVAPDLPQEPTGGNSALFVVGAIVFVLMAIGMAAFVLWVLRTGRTRILQAVFLGAVGIALLFALVRPVLALSTILPEGAVWAGAIALVVAVLWRLWVQPTRWLTNTVGIVVAAAVAAIAGAVLGVTPVLFLLVFITIYDIVAVRRTKHMVKLAHGITDLNIPVALHFGGPPPRPRARADVDGSSAPSSGSSVRLPTQPPRASAAPEAARAGAAPAPRRAKRGARGLTMGVGDLVFPSALVVAAAGRTGAVPAAAAAVGVMAGYGLLVWAAWKGEPQPGLPLLNGGAIVGFFAGLALATQSLRFW